ncbi:MAG: nucleotide exchange factor GrpE [Bacteroidia bacterium]|jgi:molecular chaperone GrpE|nr:nucleotide exchange factor GrpE [Paludibacter sp.]MDD3488692.1 nucleotide exchange factor GrpE [Paludibacter sp.]NCB68392.1 nucleotide exchange factor GrpE [Bacteroidia bacterium]
MKKQKHNAEEPEKEVVNDTAQQEQEANQQTENQTTEEEGDKIANEIAELTQKCNDLNDKNLRLMAEFDNYRKRTLKERSDLIKTAGENILSSMLPLVDDFERALKAMETAEDVVAVKEGVDLIYNKFIAFLLQNGVKAIPTDNEVFNTDLHEAITTFPAPTEDMKGKIIDCVSKGYTMNEKVIRFSKVVVGE